MTDRLSTILQAGGFKPAPLSREPLTFKVPNELVERTQRLASSKTAELQRQFDEKLEEACRQAIERGPNWCVAMSPVEFDTSGEYPTVGRRFVLVEGVTQETVEEYPGWTFLSRSGGEA